MGYPAFYDALANLGPTIIEDAAQASGAAYRDSPAGALGRVSVFSVYANKAVSTGEGGCVATDDERLAERIRLLAKHGMTSVRPYWHDVCGFKSRMTNVTAAIGLGQAERWHELVAARLDAAQRYGKALAGTGLVTRTVPP